MLVFSNATSTIVKHISENEMRGGLYDKNGKFIDFARHNRAGDQMHFAEEKICEATKFVDGKSLYGGVCFNHFGHFLMESLGRLWISNKNEYIDLPIFMNPLWGIPDLNDKSNFVSQTFEILGINNSRIKFIDSPITFEEVLVPEQLYGFHLINEPGDQFIKFLRQAQERVEGKNELNPERIYVSRAKWDVQRGFTAGETVFEDYLRSEGWFVLYPEDFNFIEQLRFYKNSRQIIFCEGSAHHALLLLPDLKAKVAILKRNAPGHYQISEDQLIGLGLDCTPIQRVNKQIQLGIPIYQALSLVDYYEASLDLQKIDFVSKDFSDWKNMNHEITLLAIKSFLDTHSGDERLLTFLADIT